jgi:YbgC/YbaW family acyl-CoA thioester hydrolase
MSTFHACRRVEFSHTDMAGIMHFAQFFCMMEEVEHEFLRSRGLSVVMEHEGQRVGFPRVAARCDFLKPVFFEDVLDIHLTLARIGGKSLTYQSEFFKNGELVARGEHTTCCCRVDGPKGVAAIDLPADMRARLESG